MRKRITVLTIAAVAALFIAALATTSVSYATPHSVTKGNGDVVVVANGQNHSGVQDEDGDGLRNSCEGTLDSDNNGPAGYGLETAHHGPDAGTPGKADGCFATVGDPVGNNPALH